MNSFIENSTPQTDDAIFSASRSKREKSMDDLLEKLKNPAPVQTNTHILSGTDLSDASTIDDNFDPMSIINSINSDNTEIIEKEKEELDAILEEEEAKKEEVIKQREAEFYKKKAEEESLVREDEQKRLEEEFAATLEDGPASIFDFTKKDIQDDNFEYEDEPEHEEPIHEELPPDEPMYEYPEMPSESFLDTLDDAVSSDETEPQVEETDDTIEKAINEIEPNEGFTKNLTEDTKRAAEILAEQKIREREQLEQMKVMGLEAKAEDAKNEANKWEYEATHDKGTGLLNKTAFDTALDNFDTKKGVLIFFDANNLKYANDVFGHEAGDKLLTSISKELTRQFENQAYRIGGDEFIVITEGSKKEIEKKIALIDKAMKIYTSNDKTGLIYSVSSGVAFANGKKDIHELKAEADKRMYENKRKYKEAHKELDLRRKETKSASTSSEDANKWKELALKDKLTGCYNRVALDDKKISKLDVLTMVAIKNAKELKTSLLEERTSLTAELINRNIDKDIIYYIENGRFVLINVNEAELETFKTKAKQVSLPLDYARVTNFTEIDSAITSLEAGIEKNKDIKDVPYDERLSVAQRRLKGNVRDNHEMVEMEDFEEIISSIRKKEDEIIAIFLTSADFNHLFIFSDAAEFVEMTYQLDGNIDFSYIYAIYEGGALYYGSDSYSKDVTDLFQTIAESIPVDQEVTEKDIQKIEGINTFEFIHFA